MDNYEGFVACLCVAKVTPAYLQWTWVSVNTQLSDSTEEGSSLIPCFLCLQVFPLSKSLGFYSIGGSSSILWWLVDTRELSANRGDLL